MRQMLIDDYVQVGLPDPFFWGVGDHSTSGRELL